jgi:hypothetical protein
MIDVLRIIAAEAVIQGVLKIAWNDGYRVQARDVTARLNNSGPPSFKINDTISVKIDPDNSEHFVFNQTPVGASIAGMFLMGIAFMGFSLLRMRARRNRLRVL